MSKPTVKKGALIFKGEVRPAGARTKMVRPKSDIADVDVRVCQGRIVSNGNTIQGLETVFSDEIQPGDSIIVRHPRTLLQEERMVTSIISQRSLNIDRPFSSDFVSTTGFSVRKEVKAPSSRTIGGVLLKEENGTEDIRPTHIGEKTQNQRSVLVYQERMGPTGSRTVIEKLDRHYTEEELLDMKCKKVHDKYC
jgi:hypothetical protein